MFVHFFLVFKIIIVFFLIHFFFMNLLLFLNAILDYCYYYIIKGNILFFFTFNFILLFFYLFLYITGTHSFILSNIVKKFCLAIIIKVGNVFLKFIGCHFF